MLNPPTIIPTLPGNSSVTSGQQPLAAGWDTFRDRVSGLAFQYPRDWQTAIGRNSQGTVTSIVVTRPNQPITDTASIVIDVRKKQGDLLAWLSQQLPAGRLLIDPKALEGAKSASSYNARVGNSPAVFLYAPAHGQLADVAELHTGDNQYFYQVTYLGSAPDDRDSRAAFLHLANTLTLTGTTSSGVTLPATTFTHTPLAHGTTGCFIYEHVRQVDDGYGGRVRFSYADVDRRDRSGALIPAYGRSYLAC